MTENTPNYLMEEEENTSGFDYKAFLVKLLMYWPWILGCVLVSIVAMFFYLKTITPIYTVSSSILIKENDAKKGMSSLEDLGFVTSSTQNFDNEIEILQSRTLIKKVVNSLNLYISYTTPGSFRDAEIYPHTPVQVWVTPEEAERMGHAEVAMNLQNNQLEVNIQVGDKSYSKHFDSLPAVFPTEAGVFSFSLPKDTLATPAPVAKLKATITSPVSAAAAYKTALNIFPSGKMTSIAQLTLTTSNIDRGYDFLRQLVALYNSDANNDKNEVASKTAEFIDERIRIINSELGTTENELAAFKQRAGVVDITTDAGIAVSERSAYEKAYADNETQIRLVEFIKTHLENGGKELAVIPGNIGLSNDNLGTLIENYNEMLLERKRLLRTSSENNPAVINLNDGIQLLRENIRQTIRSVEQSLKITRSELERQAGKYNIKIQEAPVQEKEFLSMSRQQEIKANLYLMLLQKREENNITLASTANNARVIDEPLAGGQVSPQSSQLYMIAFILGLGIPVAIIFLLDLLHFKIETRGDIEKLTKIPVVGDIPLSSEATTSPIVIRENRNELMEEVYRSVRTNLQYLLRKDEKVILFTSTTSGEGKSFNAGNLATSFAFMGKKVVIVGLDIRKPGLNKVFQISHKEQGITQYLANPEDTDLLRLCQPSALSPNLYILPGGTVPPNPTELVARQALDDAIALLKEHFDYVLLDTAPIGMVTDTQLIARVADLSVYVCRSGYTNKSDFRLINELEKEQKLQRPCILLNGIDMDKRHTGSYYGYGKYGKYGSRYGYGKKYGYGYGYGYGK